MKKTITLVLILACAQALAQNKTTLDVKHHYLDNEGVKIHFVEKGTGPLLIMLHGFPDFWYSWYPVMEVLSEEYRVVAMDLRGYNQSDAPMEVKDYDYKYLMSDVTKVIDFFEEDKTTLIAHDWGAAIGWRLTMHHPERIKKYIALSIPHLKGAAEAITESTQATGSNYTAQFFQEGFHKNININWFIRWGVDEGLVPHYKEAFARSKPEAMLKYYHANFASPEQMKKGDIKSPGYPDIDLPVLIIQGRQDPFASSKGLNNNWAYNKSATTIHVLPQGKHFLHHEDPELITKIIVQWLGLFEP